MERQAAQHALAYSELQASHQEQLAEQKHQAAASLATQLQEAVVSSKRDRDDLAAELAERQAALVAKMQHEHDRRSVRQEEEHTLIMAKELER